MSDPHSLRWEQRISRTIVILDACRKEILTFPEEVRGDPADAIARLDGTALGAMSAAVWRVVEIEYEESAKTLDRAVARGQRWWPLCCRSAPRSIGKIDSPNRNC